jgi:hypothetical protein
MPNNQYLTRRGNVFWWRRRPPSLQLRQSPTLSYCDATKTKARAELPHIAISLRTSSRVEARRRATRVNSLFEFGWERYEARMSNEDSFDFQKQFAVDLMATLRISVEQMSKLQDHLLSDPSRVRAQDEFESESKRAIKKHIPGSGEDSRSKIDDDDLENALVQLAEDRGWWQTDPDQILEQFDVMVVGMMAVQEEYVRYCAKRGLDPATALPSLAKLAQGLDDVARATGIDAAPNIKKPGSKASQTSPVSNHATNDPTKLSEFAERYLNLRSDGFLLKRRNETPDKKTGASFRANSRRNMEASVRLFIDLIGDAPVAEIVRCHIKLDVRSA